MQWRNRVERGRLRSLQTHGFERTVEELVGKRGSAGGAVALVRRMVFAEGPLRRPKHEDDEAGDDQGQNRCDACERNGVLTTEAEGALNGQSIPLRTGLVTPRILVPW